MGNLDFDAARRERLRAIEPLTFTLGGREFRCRDAFTLLDIWTDPPEAPERITKGATTEGGRYFLAIARHVADFIVPEQRDEWWDLFEDDTEVIQGVDLKAVFDALVEEYAGRPTSPSAASSNGQRAAKGGSTSSSPPDETSAGTSST